MFLFPALVVIRRMWRIHKWRRRRRIERQVQELGEDMP